ncbi:MAG TPA: hypothetical protein EYP16_05975 [Candidatus Atribacteria bacterium]|nr:hypothetical protein [Candidatus Atribacteria bacterium]
MKISTKNLALTAVFAGLFVALSALPGVPIIGGVGKIDIILAALGPVYGIILGPWLGGISAFLGALLAWFLPPGTPGLVGLVMTPCPLIGALVAGGLSSQMFNRKAWMLSLGIMGGLVLGWYISWVGISAPFYPIMHIAALIIIIIFQWRISDFIWSGSKIKNIIGVALASYAGIMADHMTGNLMFISTLGIVFPWEAIEKWLASLGLPDIPALFMCMLPISASERATMLVAATIIGSGLTLTLRKSGLIETP